MGLESHICQVLEDDPVVMAHGLDYWFEYGLKTETRAVAEAIASALNDSGEFGLATATCSPEGKWSVEFGIHPQYKRE